MGRNSGVFWLAEWFTISWFLLCGDGTLVVRPGAGPEHLSGVSQDISNVPPPGLGACHQCVTCVNIIRHRIGMETSARLTRQTPRGKESFRHLISPWWIRENTNSYHDQSPVRHADLAFSSPGCDWKLGWLIEWSPAAWGLGWWGMRHIWSPPSWLWLHTWDTVTLTRRGVTLREIGYLQFNSFRKLCLAWNLSK